MKALSWKSLCALALAALMQIGCIGDTLRSDRESYLWLLLPMLGFGLVGGMLVFYRRRRQLAEWDLAASPEQPSERVIVLTTMTVAGGLAALFVGCNLFLPAVKPSQQLANIGLWLGGSLVGGSAALLVGLRLAEPRPSRRLERKEMR